MIFPNDIDYLARKERCKDMLREAEYARLLQDDNSQQPGNWESYRKVVGWIGTRMVRWGSKLQDV